MLFQFNDSEDVYMYEIRDIDTRMIIMKKDTPKTPAQKKPRQAIGITRKKSQIMPTDELAARVSKKFERISDELDSMPF